MRGRLYERYLGIDYSGAMTADSSLRGLRVYSADGLAGPYEVTPPQGASRYWSRRGLAQWLVEQLAQSRPTIVGLDHGFSFPWRYFEDNQLERNWPSFLEDFRRHWPTDEIGVSVEHVRLGKFGSGSIRVGNSRWRRTTEIRVGAKSVFHFDVPGSVAKSTHAGLPWLYQIREQLGSSLHFWPFDGWEVPAGRSVIAEAYPSLWKSNQPCEGLTPDQRDAWAVANWLREADHNGKLVEYLQPPLTTAELELARVEGWILGVL